MVHKWVPLQQKPILYFFFFIRKKNLFSPQKWVTEIKSIALALGVLILIWLLLRNHDPIIQLFQSFIFFCEKWG